MHGLAGFYYGERLLVGNKHGGSVRVACRQALASLSLNVPHPL